MPQIEIITHARTDGSVVLEADVTSLDGAVRHDEVTPDGRMVRYFDFGIDAPDDAAMVVVAQLRAELPVPASEPPQTTTVEL